MIRPLLLAAKDRFNLRIAPRHARPGADTFLIQLPGNGPASHTLLTVRLSIKLPDPLDDVVLTWIVPIGFTPFTPTCFGLLGFPGLA